jgi:hypothetical protein
MALPLILAWKITELETFEMSKNDKNSKSNIFQNLS